MKSNGMLLLCLAALLCCTAQARKTTTKSSGTLNKAYIEQSLEAWSTMDVNKIAPYYSKALDNVYYDIAPLEYHGWSEWAQGIPKLFADYKSFKLTLKDEPKIHIQGNWAWSTELWHVDAVHNDGKTESFDGRDTAVWQKQNGKWLIVHEHDSVPIAENK